MRSSTICTLSVALLTALPVAATAQTADTILVNGKIVHDAMPK